MNTSQSRPTFVTLLGVFEIISGVLGLIGGGCVGTLGLFGLGQLLGGADGGVAANQTAAGAGMILGIFGLGTAVLAIAAIILGVGLLQLKQWAYRLALIVAIINIVFNVIAVIVTLTSGGNLGQALAGHVGPLAINAVILYWLNHADVKRAFAV